MWTFYGPTATLTATNSQKIGAAGVAVLRGVVLHSHDIDVCFANTIDSSFVFPFNSTNFLPRPRCQRDLHRRLLRAEQRREPRQQQSEHDRLGDVTN